jgi:hypothetical protein
VLQKQPQLTVQIREQKLEAGLCQFARCIQQARLHEKPTHVQSRKVFVRPQRGLSALHKCQKHLLPLFIGMFVALIDGKGYILQWLGVLDDGCRIDHPLPQARPAHHPLVSQRPQRTLDTYYVLSLCVLIPEGGLQLPALIPNILKDLELLEQYKALCALVYILRLYKSPQQCVYDRFIDK